MGRAKDVAKKIGDLVDWNIIIEGKHNPDCISYITSEGVDKIEQLLKKEFDIE